MTIKPLREAEADARERAVRRAMRVTNQNQLHAAKLLGIHRNTLGRILRSKRRRDGKAA
jgi:DNA-binding protein Fis